MADEQDGTTLAKTIRDEIEELRPKIFNPFSILVEKLCVVTSVPDVPANLQEKRDRVRFALVSMPEFRYELREFSSVRRDVEPPALDRDACKRKLVEFCGPVPQQMFGAFTEALHTALGELKADVVCFSELGLPSFEMMPMLEANQLAGEMSREHGALIIAGSVHDSRTLYNTAYLFHPGSPEHGTAFHKSISAVTVKERISAPSSRRVPLVEIFGLKIATMICLDIADYATLASVVKCADRVDILLVPCYTPKFEKMSQIAKAASKALPGVVALVNTNLPDEEAEANRVWHFGRREDLIRRPLKSGAVISCLDVDHKDFRSKRTQWKASAKDDMAWLFGSRDLPSVFR